MKKTFPLHAPGKADARVLDAIKHEVRKYVKRERRKSPPEGFDGWSFSCKVGASPALAVDVTLKEISAAIDRVAAEEHSEIFLAVVAIPATQRALNGPA